MDAPTKLNSEYGDNNHSGSYKYITTKRKLFSCCVFDMQHTHDSKNGIYFSVFVEIFIPNFFSVVVEGFWSSLSSCYMYLRRCVFLPVGCCCHHYHHHHQCGTHFATMVHLLVIPPILPRLLPPSKAARRRHLGRVRARHRLSR